jgi:hypothetical protein
MMRLLHLSLLTNELTSDRTVWGVVHLQQTGAARPHLRAIRGSRRAL